jgi:hypothetical protein
MLPTRRLPTESLATVRGRLPPVLRPDRMSLGAMFPFALVGYSLTEVPPLMTATIGVR